MDFYDHLQQNPNVEAGTQHQLGYFQFPIDISTDGLQKSGNIQGLSANIFPPNLYNEWSPSASLMKQDMHCQIDTNSMLHDPSVVSTDEPSMFLSGMGSAYTSPTMFGEQSSPQLTSLEYLPTLDTQSQPMYTYSSPESTSFTPESYTFTPEIGSDPLQYIMPTVEIMSPQPQEQQITLSPPFSCVPNNCYPSSPLSEAPTSPDTHHGAQLRVPKTKQTDGRKNRGSTPMDSKLTVTKAAAKAPKKVAAKDANKVPEPKPLVHMNSDHELKQNGLEVPKSIIQNGNGRFVISISGRADHRVLYAIAIPTDQQSFILENFCSNVSANGEIHMNIKFVRINCEKTKVGIIVKICDTDLKQVLVVNVPDIPFYTNTKDLPYPTIAQCTPSTPNSDGLTLVKVTADRLKWGSTNLLNFFLVDKNNIIKHIVHQREIGKPEPTKTMAFFNLPSNLLGTGELTLYARYVCSSASRTKAGKQTTILPSTVSDNWIHGNGGSIMV